MMLFRNTKVKVYFLDGGTAQIFFNIVAGVLQGDTLYLYLYLFIIWLDDMLRTSIDKWKKKKRFQANEGKKQKLPHTTIMDSDYANDIAWRAN